MFRKLKKRIPSALVCMVLKISSSYWKIEKSRNIEIQKSTHRDCNINLKLNHKITGVFYNLENSDSNLIMQELDKFNLKINIIPNGLEKYMSFTGKKLSFILSSSLESLLKNLIKDGFKYLSQEFDNNVLDLVKQKGFYTYECMSDFENFKEEFSSK